MADQIKTFMARTIVFCHVGTTNVGAEFRRCR